MRSSRHFPHRRWALLTVGALAGPMLLAPAAAAQSSGEVCAEVLVAISPDAIEGDETAVAITSQQLDADVEGWTQVSWQAADTTTLTAVTIHTNDGTTTRTDDLDTGTAQNALQLTFCGTTDTEAPGTDNTDASDDDTEDGAAGSTGDEVTEVPDSGTAPSGGSGAGNGGSGSPPDADEASDTSDEASPETSVPTGTVDTEDSSAVQDEDAADPDDSATADGSVATADDAADETDGSDTAGDADEETEVLGVQLTQEDDGAGWMLPVLLFVAAAVAVAVGIAIRNRRLTQAGGR